MTIYGIQAIPLELIDPNPWQTRKGEDPEHVLELAKSVFKEGLLEIPIGRRMGEDPQGRVQLAFGHSRLAAFKLLVEQGNIEFGTMPVNLRIGISDEQMAILAFTENEKRKELNPVERATAISAMLRDFGWTQQQVADKLTIDRSSVSNSLRMLRMPADVLTSIADGCLPVRTAMALLPFYELTPLEITVLAQNYPDSDDFVALARSGQINSDTVRQQVDKYMQILHPEPDPVAELPLVETTETPKVPSEEEWDSTPKAGGERNEAPIQVEGNTLTEEPAQEAEAQEQQPQPSPQEPPIPVKEESRSAPAEEPQPAAPVISNDKVVVLRWYETGGVSVSVQLPGEKFPKFIYKTSLLVDEISVLLASMGIE